MAWLGCSSCGNRYIGHDSHEEKLYSLGMPQKNKYGTFISWD